MKKLFLAVFFIFLIFGQAWAQMTDEQLINWLQNAQKQGMTQQEMLVQLMQKGVTQEQLLRLKNAYSKQGNALGNASVVSNRMRQTSQINGRQGKRNLTQQDQNMNFFPIAGEGSGLLDSLSVKMKNSGNPVLRSQNKVFGREIFNNKLLTFEPNLNIATPENYVLGPGDEVIVDIWGDSEQTFRQRISPDGTITDSKIGPVYLNGVSIREANQRLKNAFSRIYSTMGGANPTTYINLSLGEIRSIRVNVMGEVVLPGTYVLPSLASLFHALYSAGGVNDIGSLRGVKVSRAGKELAQVDVYQYILDGKSSLDIRLEEGDVIVVPPYQNLVILKGKVKRPLVYEMKDEETIKDLLDFAGGFTGDAYKKALRVIRKSGREYQVYNVEETDFQNFTLKDGDEVTVDSVLRRFENRVEIKGAVYRAGLYALGEGVSTIRQLIEKAEGVRGDAFLNRAVLYRERPDFTLEAMGIDVAGILTGSVEDLPLRKNDVLYIPAISDLQEEYTVTVRGAVGFPGVYKYVADMTLEDLVIQAGGLKESASVVKIDVARRIKQPKSKDYGNMLAENFTLSLQDGFMVGGENNFVLQPFDEVYVRRSPGYQQQQNVSIEGEVLFAGTYTLSQKGERLSDLIKKAGGLAPEAYVAGARLTRKLNAGERARVETLLKLTQQKGKDSIDMNRLDIGDYYFVGIDLEKAVNHPGSDYDIVLREGDRLSVPEYTGTVKISGAVMYPNTVVYDKNAKLRDYIEQGGGFADRAKKRKVFIVYMNGTVAKSKPFAKAKATPGCEIIVPVKPSRKGIGLAEVMGIASSTTSMAALVTSIINSTK